MRHSPLNQERAFPPIPILGGFSQDEHGRIERTWKNAPSIVRDARLLAVLGIVVNVVLVATGIVGVFFSMIAEHPEGNRVVGVSGGVIFGQFLEVIFYIALIALHVWLILGLRLGARSAWKTELVLAIVGLAGLPIGTLIGIYILSRWTQLETKRWFGFEV